MNDEKDRRRFLQYSLAALAAPGLVSAASRTGANDAGTAGRAAPHIVLLGDSIFDNASYTGGKPDVIAQLRKILPAEWKATLLARDGATTEGIPDQIDRLPPDATHLVLSVGGNNALMQQHLLQARTATVSEGLTVLADAVHRFEAAYRKVIAACLARKLPFTVCTVYNGNFPDPGYRIVTSSAIALFNDAILRSAVEHKLKVIELRLVCTLPEDYANPIEPSSAGAAKIARAILASLNARAAENGATILS
ncbi:SGNH/GDSL hydrolase family protein [Noviherbaspirillum sp. CPCC 100848]|uniref:SGNH/GDSL hydrolase family protein n=1 Tax=Noviherbaspirillum album TaxID=3080276 RepID=A0ABU6J690_9BURK|nr:SGNH/GDSL hydrolase family protein [Noviherbaspirillum sp. CPCC 100848]MEC4719161.1 SGNH/GDSL hydrolase family protein [Noviherbaspirillum sp. CPCC 100848]